MELCIQPVRSADKTWIENFYRQRWGSARVVSRGVLYQVSELLGFIAWLDGEAVGLLTFNQVGGNLQIVTLDSLKGKIGVGTALIEAVLEHSRASTVKRVWLITTNDNTQALRFYQKQGFRISAVHKDAIQESRLMKPEIPATGLDGIPIRDEIELEYELT